MRKIRSRILSSIQENKVHPDFEKVILMLKEGKQIIVADDGSRLKLQGEFDVLELETLVRLFDTNSTQTKSKKGIVGRIDEAPIKEEVND